MAVLSLEQIRPKVTKNFTYILKKQNNKTDSEQSPPPLCSPRRTAASPAGCGEDPARGRPGCFPTRGGFAKAQACGLGTVPALRSP